MMVIASQFIWIAITILALTVIILMVFYWKYGQVFLLKILSIISTAVLGYSVYLLCGSTSITFFNFVKSRDLFSFLIPAMFVIGGIALYPIIYYPLRFILNPYKLMPSSRRTETMDEVSEARVKNFYYSLPYEDKEEVIFFEEVPCEFCGTINPNETIFCASCGTKLTKDIEDFFDEDTSSVLNIIVGTVSSYNKSKIYEYGD